MGQYQREIRGIFIAAVLASLPNLGFAQELSTPPKGVTISLPASMPKMSTEIPAALRVIPAAKPAESLPTAAAVPQISVPAVAAGPVGEIPKALVATPPASAAPTAQPAPSQQAAAGSAWVPTASIALRPSARALTAAPTQDAGPATAANSTPEAQRAETAVDPRFQKRPKQRPDGLKVAVAAAEPAAETISNVAQVMASVRPAPRPERLERQVRRAARNQSSASETLQSAAVVRPAPGAGAMASPRGSLCGISGLSGEMIAPIAGRIRGCGIAQPVRITAVDGVRLSQAATIDCDTARALHTWVRTGLKPAFGNTGGGITGMHVAAHYACRPRNNRPGAAISEHGRGKGIDIAGITFANGQSLSILRDYKGRNGARLKAAHRAACGIFGTTLGPGSDGYHEDHLHFDSKSRRQAYCR